MGSEISFLFKSSFRREEVYPRIWDLGDILTKIDYCDIILSRGGGNRMTTHPKIARGLVWCRKCGISERVNPAVCMRSGWPKCCGQTMTIDAPWERASLKEEVVKTPQKKVRKVKSTRSRRTTKTTPDAVKRKISLALKRYFAAKRKQR